MRIGKTLIAAMAAAGLSGGLGCEEQPQQPGGGGQDTGQPPATQPSSPDQDQGMDRQQLLTSRLRKADR